jgi:hydroxymethylpyrimidine pyrophosphatase-like HAD family hydrolase
MLERLMGQGTPPEFVLAIGDEASDEVMFTGIEQFKVSG